MSERLPAKAHIDLKSGVVQLEGSESFVERNLEWLKALITPKGITPLDLVATDSEPTAAPSLSPDNDSEAERCERHFGLPVPELNKVINLEESEFSIIAAKIPATSNSERQIKYCLMHCLASEYYGKPVVPFAELRELCKHMGCFDAKNFAEILTNAKPLFIVGGAKGSKDKTAKLTMPGRDKARSVIAEAVPGGAVRQ